MGVEVNDNDLAKKNELSPREYESRNQSSAFTFGNQDNVNAQTQNRLGSLGGSLFGNQQGGGNTGFNSGFQQGGSNSGFNSGFNFTPNTAFNQNPSSAFGFVRHQDRDNSNNSNNNNPGNNTFM